METKPKLAIIGGSYLQLPLVLKAKELDIETHCFSWLDGAICKDYADYFYPISIIDKEEILLTCKKIGINGVTSIASDAAVPTINYVAGKLGLIGNPEEKSELYVDKYKMRIALADANINVPKFFRLSEALYGNCNSEIERNAVALPMIVKPVDRSGSRGVFKINLFSQLEPMILRAAKESFSKTVIVEEFIDGREYSVESISWNGVHHILAITEKTTTGEPFFVELAHHQPANLTDIYIKRVKDFTVRSLSALQIKYGASHTEIKITKEGVIYLIETGARMGGDFIGAELVRLSTGYDFLKGVIEIALGSFEEPIIEERGFSGVYYLSKETENIKMIIDKSENYRCVVKAELLDDNLKLVNSSTDRSGYFIYHSDHKVEISELLG